MDGEGQGRAGYVGPTLTPATSHFLLQFDTNPRVLHTLSSRLQADPRVIKWTTLKLGERLDQITPRTPDDSPHRNHNNSSHMGGGVTVVHGNR